MNAKKLHKCFDEKFWLCAEKNENYCKKVGDKNQFNGIEMIYFEFLRNEKLIWTNKTQSVSNEKTEVIS